MHILEMTRIPQLLSAVLSVVANFREEPENPFGLTFMPFATRSRSSSFRGDAAYICALPSAAARMISTIGI